MRRLLEPLTVGRLDEVGVISGGNCDIANGVRRLEPVPGTATGPCLAELQEIAINSHSEAIPIDSHPCKSFHDRAEFLNTRKGGGIGSSAEIKGIEFRPKRARA